MQGRPPAPGQGRIAIKEDTLGGYHVPVGTTVFGSTYAMHRHPDYWTEPEVFDPSCFSPEKVKERPRFLYLPFGAGQRVCIGSMLASLMATLSTVLLTQRYRLEAVPGKKVRPLTGGAHFPDNLWLKVLPARAGAPASRPSAVAG
jgi:cytochrome P450